MGIEARTVLQGKIRSYHGLGRIVIAYEEKGTEDIVQGLLNKIERLESSATNGLRVIERLASKNEELRKELESRKLSISLVIDPKGY